MAGWLYLLIEAVGCPTACRHCWAQGTPYRAMPVGDVGRVLEEPYRVCADHGLGFGAYPMPELAAHPQAAELLRLFAGHVGAAEVEPLATTGVPLATRQDWRPLLAAAAELGTATVGSPSTVSASNMIARSSGPAPGPRPAWPSGGCTRPACEPAATWSSPWPMPARPGGCLEPWSAWRSTR